MAENKKDGGIKIVVQNRDARHRFFISDTLEAGLVLTGTEVKSLRNGKGVINDAFVFFKSGEAFLENLHISEYSHGNRENHAPTRPRKLLLHKKEIIQLTAQVQQQGNTIVPLKIYFSKGRAKVELGVGKGKKIHDKRASIREKEDKRSLAKVTKRSARY